MQNLLALMDQVNSSGEFATSGTLSSIPSGLSVDGVGNIGLPLTEQQAKELIKRSEQAPFGRREETVVDTDVRKNWQISAEDFELTNPQWQGVMQKAIDQIGKGLGLSDCTISFEKYKLLIYEEGSFFTAHRDTEKIPNMFATMVISLPSEHQGGELIISHAGHSQSYSFADNSLFEPSYVAFYADCYHEVKPITSGYRICLIYNLAITNRKEQPDLAQQLGVMRDVEQVIQTWKENPGEVPISTYLLDHSYSEQNLSMSNLKLDDFAKASVLLNAAENSGCKAYLCLATYYQSSYGEVEGYGYGRYSYDEPDESDFEEYEVDEEEVYAESFVTADGTTIGVEKLHLDEDTLIATIPLRAGPGRDYSISEATGNEGATKELWYHRGAVIMWPADRELDLVARMDVGYGVHVLKTSLQDRKKLDEQTRQQLVRLADHILDAQSMFRNEDVFAELMTLEDVDLVKKYLFKQANSWSLRVDPEKFVSAAQKFRWPHFADEVESRLTAHDSLEWLDSLLQTGKSISDDGQELIRQWVESRWEEGVATATRKLSAPVEPTTARGRRGHKYDVARFGQEKSAQKFQLVYIMRLASCLRMTTLADSLTEQLNIYSEKRFLTETYGPAVLEFLDSIQKRKYDQNIAQQFTGALRTRIQTEFPTSPEPPQNWSREGQLECDCEFCTQVNEFLPTSDVAEIYIGNTLKRNLLHVEDEAEKMGLELDIEIGKRSNKFHGTIRKNQNRYEVQQSLYDVAQDLIQALPS